MTRLPLQALYDPASLADADWPEPTRARKRKLKIRAEDSLQIACVRYLRGLDSVRFMVVQPERINAPPRRRDLLGSLGILHNAGHPELIVIDARFPLNPRVWFLELKRPKGSVSQEQLAWAAWLRDAGFNYALVRSVEELTAVIG